MASHVSVRRLWRDVRLVYVLLVWAAFGAGLVLYFDSSVTVGRSPSAPADQTAAADKNAIYTGSIIVVPRTGDDCWRMMLDNRTGRLWENGYVRCDEVVGALAASRANRDASRLNAIGASFREGK